MFCKLFNRSICIFCLEEINAIIPRNIGKNFNLVYEGPHFYLGFPNPLANRCWLNAELHVLLDLPVLKEMDSIKFFGQSKVISIFAALVKAWKSGYSNKHETYKLIM